MSLLREVLAPHLRLSSELWCYTGQPLAHTHFCQSFHAVIRSHFLRHPRKLESLGLGLGVFFAPLFLFAAVIVLTWISPKSIRGGVFLLSMLALSFIEFAIQDAWRLRTKRIRKESAGRG